MITVNENYEPISNARQTTMLLASGMVLRIFCFFVATLTVGISFGYYLGSCEAVRIVSQYEVTK